MATRDRIVEAAERLFARQGVEATSLRQITREAEANVASIHYHFGSREALLRAVLDRTVGPLNQRRLELLDAALARCNGGPLSVEEILDAFLRPDVEAIERLRDGRVEIARFLGRLYASPTPEVERIIGEQFREARRRFLAELGRALPGVTEEELLFGLSCVVGVIVTMFAGTTPRGESGALDTAGIDPAVRRLVGFLAPGFAALPAERRGAP